MGEPVVHKTKLQNTQESINLSHYRITISKTKRKNKCIQLFLKLKDLLY